MRTFAYEQGIQIVVGDARGFATSQRHEVVYLFSSEKKVIVSDDDCTSIDDFADFLTSTDSSFAGKLANARKGFGKIVGDTKITIKSLRRNAGLSQADLAKVLGTSQPHIARIESRPEAMMLGTGIKLARALGVDISVIAALSEGVSMESSDE